MIFFNLFVVEIFLLVFLLLQKLPWAFFPQMFFFFLLLLNLLKKHITFFKKRKNGEICWDEELGILVVGCNANKDATTTHNVELIASWPVIASNRCQSCIGVYKLRRSSFRHDIDVWTRQK